MGSLINRIRCKILRDFKKHSWEKTQHQSEMTFSNKNAGWYDIVIGGPSTFAKECCSSETISSVISILK